MSARDIVGGLAGAAVSAAKWPLATTFNAVGLAKGVVTTGAAAAEGIAQHAADRMRRHHAAPVTSTESTESDSAESGTAETSEAENETAEPRVDRGASEPADAATEPAAEDTTATTAETTAGTTAGPTAAAAAAATVATASKKAAKKTPAKKASPRKSTAKKSAANKAAPRKAAEDRPADDGPQVVLREPAPPQEPPIDIVGQVLAAEAEEEPHAGRAGEPRGASRDEEHGEASLERAELDEIAEETAEALPGGDIDVETPVGTTGAGVAFNPDTAEADLQQPKTPPLMDPALTKQVKAAQRTGKKASEKAPKK